MDMSVAVVGGGAAGMAAAIKAAWQGANVTLYERGDRLGRKLAITGKGRCNVTNNCTVEEFLHEVTKNPKFLYSAASRYSPEYVMSFFESLGVPLKTERGRRVFPQSDRAADVVSVMRGAMHDAGVHVVTGYRVRSVRPLPNGALEVSDGRRHTAHSAVIVCTGGISYPATGSTGDGYAIARENGLAVMPPVPSLVPIVTTEDTSELSGLTLKNVRLTLSRNGRRVFTEMGEMLFTHFGISGPLVLSASCHMRESISEYAIEIDLKPAIPDSELEERIDRLLTDGAAKDFVNATSHLLPQKLVRTAACRAGIPERQKAGDVSREMRIGYTHMLKHFPLTPVEFRPAAEAIVTSGGVDTRALDPRTMETKAVPGLFFAGEVIDIDAYTGGYNLQIAFSTGFAAADGAAARAESLR